MLGLGGQVRLAEYQLCSQFHPLGPSLDRKASSSKGLPSLNLGTQIEQSGCSDDM